jgi:hypothetical protein
LRQNLNPSAVRRKAVHDLLQEAISLQTHWPSGKDQRDGLDGRCNVLEKLYVEVTAKPGEITEDQKTVFSQLMKVFEADFYTVHHPEKLDSINQGTAAAFRDMLAQRVSDANRLHASALADVSPTSHGPAPRIACPPQCTPAHEKK